VSDLTHYVFRSIWHVRARRRDLMSVLDDLESYPAWWPEIREVRPLGARRFEVVARSFLPYELRFVTDADEPRAGLGGPKAVAGIIEVRLSGDMEGTMRWTVEESDDGCRLVYDQEVSTNKRLLNVMAPVARPGFKANHALMMRHGEAGLRTFMAGYLLGASSSRER
jgi:hypothetical protein